MACWPAGALEVVVDDGVVVDVVVVVAAAWHTEMLTVLPPLTCALAAGLWLSTLPGWAPLGHDVSKVVLATRPAPVMADVAALCDCPTTPGTETQLPLDTTRLTEVLGCTLVPGTGFWEDTSPLGWLEHAVLWLPTFSPAWVRVEPALAGDCPITLGTGTMLCVAETVRTTLRVAGILVPAVGS